ncbi:MAG: hypothetical protein WBC33_07105 [Conexibacter sp.]
MRTRGVDARRYTAYPVRHWNRWLGPLHRRIFLVEDVRRPTPIEQLVPIELGDPARLDDRDFALSPDGRVLVTVRQGDPDALMQTPDELVRVELASGEERVMAAGRHQYGELAIATSTRSRCSTSRRSRSWATAPRRC